MERTTKVPKHMDVKPVEQRLKIGFYPVVYHRLQVPIFRGTVKFKDKEYVYELLAHYEKFGRTLKLKQVFHRVWKLVEEKKDHWVVSPLDTEEELNILAKLSKVFAPKREIYDPTEAKVQWKHIEWSEKEKRWILR